MCCTRCPDACFRLGTSTVGLLPLAASATGQGIRSRILAMQLLTNACDEAVLGHGTPKSVLSGHTSVSEALSTLRLRCGEPVRFRLLVGMLNSGGGTGELQVHGLRFINTFLESAENIQNRLYLQTELYQAGCEPNNLIKVMMRLMLSLTKTDTTLSPKQQQQKSTHFHSLSAAHLNIIAMGRPTEGRNQAIREPAHRRRSSAAARSRSRPHSQPNGAVRASRANTARRKIGADYNGTSTTRTLRRTATRRFSATECVQQRRLRNAGQTSSGIAAQRRYAITAI